MRRAARTTVEIFEKYIIPVVDKVEMMLEIDERVGIVGMLICTSVPLLAIY